MADVLSLVGGGVAAFAATWLLRLYALRTDMLDIPNQRSSHTVATPRGGGLGIVIVVLGFFGASVLLGEPWMADRMPLFAAAALVAVIGFIDDHRDLSARLRFASHVLAAIVVVVACDGLAPIAVGEQIVDLGLAGDMLAVIFLVWFTNLFNFMDGIDGLAGVETITVAGGILVLIGLQGGTPALFLAMIVAATLGFLAWMRKRPA